MVSRVGLIMRTTAARERGDAAIAHLIGSHDLGELGSQPPQDRDPEVRSMLREEWLADVLEALAFGPPVSDEASDESDSDVNLEEQEGDATDEPRVEVPNDEPLVGDGDEEAALESDEDVESEPDEPTDEDPGEGIDLKSLVEMKREDLESLAVDLGIDDAADKSVYRNKDALAEKVKVAFDAQATPDEV